MDALREFAGHAIVGILANPSIYPMDERKETPNTLAKRAFVIAAEMVREMERLEAERKASRPRSRV